MEADVQTNKSDRRIQRTRRLLQEALTSLMSEKAYAKISIQDILDRANVGRSTFYAHYQGKEDLLLRGVAKLGPQNGSGVTARDSSEQTRCQGLTSTISMLGMFTHVKDNGPLRKVMFKENQADTLLKQGTAVLYTNLKTQLQELADNGSEPAIPIPILAQYLTGGLMALVKWWTDNDLSPSPKEMDELFQQIAMPGIWKVFGTNENTFGYRPAATPQSAPGHR